MNRRSLLERIGAAGVATVAVGTASARNPNGGGAGTALVRFPGTSRGDVTIQDDCVVECCSDCPLHCDGCLCGDPSC